MCPGVRPRITQRDPRPLVARAYKEAEGIARLPRSAKMALFPQDIAAEIDRRVTATVQAANCPAHTTAAEVRADAIEYLDTVDEENERFPEEVGDPYVNLWMDDNDYANALFIVVVFLRDGI